jgi:hypothetical protein
MSKPMIWKMDGEWYCGSLINSLTECVIGWGDSPAEAYADWISKGGKL